MAAADILNQDLLLLEHEQLLETAEALKKGLQESQIEKFKLEGDLKQVKDKVLSFPSSTSSTESPTGWIRAEIDSPMETTWFWFRRRSKYRMVIVYDRRSRTIAPCSRQSLENEHAGIYSKIPSRSKSIFYVFVEAAITGDTSGEPQKQFWVSTKERPPRGYELYTEVHFETLSWLTKTKIWTGQIKWLYILPPERPKHGYVQE